MSSTVKRRIAATLIVVGTIAYFAIVHYVSEPAPTRAQNPPDPPAPPKISIVFVIDSSRNMMPPIGPTYFDLARDGVARFLARPGLMSDGTYEVAVIQYSQMDAPGYIQGQVPGTGPLHWIAPTVIDDAQTKSNLIAAVNRMERSAHFSASLMESGIREATELLDTAVRYPNPPVPIDRHMILLSTGEYRLPPPCPTAAYSDVVHGESTGCDADEDTICSFENTVVMCNRACYVREAVSDARAAGIRVSTMRLGPDWRNMLGVCPEDDNPYELSGTTTDYCPNPGPNGPEPARPDRDGFLKELSNWGSAQPDGTRAACEVGVDVLGQNARIFPFYCFNTSAEECEPGTPQIIADTLAAWFCGWLPDEADPYNTGNADRDYVGTSMRPLYDICDNCPYVKNPRQRDCNENGIGDRCEAIANSNDWDAPSTCGPGTADTDCDGMPDSHDQCPGGDDCLLAHWTSTLRCAPDDDPNTCDCDCDHDCVNDACQGAIAVGDHTLPPFWESVLTWDAMWDLFDTDRNGLADYCDVPGRCKPYPAICDPEEADENGGYYREEFTFGAGTNFSASLGNTGWYLSDNRADAAATIVEEGGETFLRLVPAPGVEENGQPVSWYVESPGQIIPASRCGPSACETPAMTRWGVYAVNIEMRIQAPTDLGGPTYDLYIMDPYQESWDDAKRVHLRFVNDHQANTGRIYAEYWTSTLTVDEDGLYEFGHYPKNAWVTMTFVFNLATYYDADSCLPQSSVTALRTYNDPDPAVSGSYGFGSDKYQPILGLFLLTSMPGVQVVVETNNETGTENHGLDVRRIELRPTTQCEWRDKDDIACDSDQHCRCYRAWNSTQTFWQCGDLDTNCVDASNTPIGQCFPPDGVSCAEDCAWICGDGYTQSPGGVSGQEFGAGAVPYEETCAFFGLTHCAAGQEGCDDGNNWTGDGCSATCTIEESGPGG